MLEAGIRHPFATVGDLPEAVVTGHTPKPLHTTKKRSTTTEIFGGMRPGLKLSFRLLNPANTGVIGSCGNDIVTSPTPRKLSTPAGVFPSDRTVGDSDADFVEDKSLRGWTELCRILVTPSMMMHRPHSRRLPVSTADPAGFPYGCRKAILWCG